MERTRGNKHPELDISEENGQTPRGGDEKCKTDGWVDPWGCSNSFTLERLNRNEMKQKSRKAKGRKLQNFVRAKVLKAFRHLKKDDVICVENYKPGADIILSKVAKKLLPYSFECKNQEKMKTIYDFYNQAYKNSGKLEPVLVMKMNTREPLVVIDFEHFIDLIKPE